MRLYVYLLWTLVIASQRFISIKEPGKECSECDGDYVNLGSDTRRQLDNLNVLQRLVWETEEGKAGK